jgi:hypothetical protein
VAADVDLTILTPELGLEMALLRPPGSIMPMWSRMAMAEYAADGMTYADLAELFRCGKSAVWRIAGRLRAALGQEVAHGAAEGAGAAVNADQAQNYPTAVCIADYCGLPINLS